LGHQTTSRWLWRSTDNIEDLADDTAADVAAEDIADILACDTLLLFAALSRQVTTRGGRFVEAGLALGRGKTVITVGPIENVFCTLPALQNFPSFQDFDQHLRDMPRGYNTLSDCIGALQH
jgi:hypothetical protein